MTTTLTNIEKKAIVDQALKQVDYSIYSAELELLQLNAVTVKDTDQIAAYENTVAKLNAKRSALVTEQATVTESI